MNPSTRAVSPWTYPFMNQRYPNFPDLWKPKWLPLLFIVKVPQDIQTLGEKTYLELMQTRLDGMIQQWISEKSLAATKELLTESLEQLDPLQAVPILEDDPDWWRQQWAETLIRYNTAFQERLRYFEVSFPSVPIEPTHPEYTDWLELHQATHLEEWLVNLIP